MIYACISTTTISVLVNGEPTDAFHPQRGIRQGCPLSPNLFVLAVNELSIRLQNNIDCNNIQGITLGPNSPHIHSLLFADDLIICGQATLDEATKINSVLQNFCTLSGQMPNLSKSSILFSKCIDQNNRQVVRSVFLVSTIHLGHPLIFNHSDRSKAYEFILTKFRAKLTTIKANKLNHASRLTYINSVMASIPIYYMSMVLFSKNFISKITSIIRKFWWAGVQEDNSTSPFHFRSWEDICQNKEKGGLGIRDLSTVNHKKKRSQHCKSQSNSSCCLEYCHQKNPFVTAILKSKYYPNTSFWLSSNSNTKSIFWGSILQMKQILTNQCTIQIHKGDSSQPSCHCTFPS